MLSGFLKSLFSGRATFDDSERGAKMAKLLFVKYRGDKTCARAVTVDETGFHWRSIENQADLKTAISDERFALVLADHPGTESEVLAYVETLRQSQVQANLFLLCGRLELPRIIRAIRLGVRDLFYPPVDVRAIVGRIRKLLPAVARADPGPQLEKWDALAAFLSHADGTPPTAP
jgi:DNA-binding NtrC family response regulator